MKFNLVFRNLLLLMIAVSFIACEADDVSDLPRPLVSAQNQMPESELEENRRIERVISSTTLNTNIAITTVDESGEYIDNVSVLINDVTYRTSSAGRVLVENITVNEDFLFITGNKIGYETIMKTVTPSTNGMTIVELTLRNDVPEQTFSGEDGGRVTFGAVSLDFPNEGIIDENGDLYTGAVTINTVYHDPNADNFVRTQPGALIGLEANDDLAALESFGMITVDLMDVNGAPLNLAPGQTANITMPASADAPDEIPLWNLNETHGLWVEVGTALKNGNVYEFEVEHFSSYNLDVIVDALEEICFEVQDVNGTPIANQQVVVRVDGEVMVEVSTDNEGDFCLLNAPIGNYTVELDLPCETLVASQNIQTAGVYTYEYNFANSSSTRLVDYSGQVFFCNNELARDKGFVIEFLDAGIRKYLFGYSDENGNYNIQTLLCDIEPDIYRACVHVLDDGIDRINNFSIDLSQDELVFDLTGCRFVIAFNDRTIISIPDENLRIAVSEQLGQNVNELITYGDAQSLSSLVVPASFNQRIESMEGLELFTNLDTLNLELNNISDLSPLEGLTSLNFLCLSNNNISDITPLSGLLNLEALVLSNNNVTDMSPLTNLSNLKVFNIGSNGLVDISQLADLTTLEDLILVDNNIVDIGPLAGLTNLESLFLIFNDISDVSPLQNLTTLLDLRLQFNDISDVTPLQGLTNLESLTLQSNDISTLQREALAEALLSTQITF